MATIHGGKFEFKYLRQGKYKVYKYSKDKTLTSQSGDTVMVRELEIISRKQNLTLDPIIIYN